jgi:hypothetical protein
MLKVQAINRTSIPCRTHWILASVDTPETRTHHPKQTKQNKKQNKLN